MFAYDPGQGSEGGMHVYTWVDYRRERTPRALIQRGECDKGQCEQFAVSISDGRMGMTIRFDSRAELDQFLACGETSHAA